jgi:hypothetical protein
MRDDDHDGDGLPKPGSDVSTDSGLQAGASATFAPDPNISSVFISLSSEITL